MDILLIILGVLVILYIAVSILLFRAACLRKGKAEDLLRPFTGDLGEYNQAILDGQKWIRANCGEKIYIKSRDGLKLAGLLIPAKAEVPKGTIIAFHGYRSRALIDFAPEAEFLVGLGYNLILPSQRSHDESEGKYITFGAKEKTDCRLWAEYADKNFGGDLFLAGISMGSATVMMASSLPLPASVRGIIADCGYTSAADIMVHVAGKLPVIKHLLKVLIPPAFLLCKLCAGFDPKLTSAKEALGKTDIPVLFIHGALDDFVPAYMTDVNFDSCKSEKRRLIIEGAQHAQAYAHSPKTCQEAMESFISDFSTK